MKQRLLSTSFLLTILVNFGINFAYGQNSPSNNELNKQVSRKIVRVDPAGFVRLPEGFKVYNRKGFIDAWFGYIESADEKFRIDYSAGMVESLFYKYKKKFKWTSIERDSKYPITFGLMRIKKKDVLVARTRWIEFSAPIKQKIDEDIFMEIVRSYSWELK